VYSITDDGLAELRRWVVSDEESPPPRDPLLLRAVFFDMVDAEHAIAILEKSIEEQGNLIERWTEHRDLLAAKATPLLRERLRRRPAADHDRVAQLKAHVFDGKIAVAQARVQWAREGIEILRGKTRRGGAPYARASA
jgi:DNA-binding PadR family transcriptional regulator